MIRSLCFTLHLLLPCTLIQAELKFASDDYPPFTDVHGQPRVAIELVETALKRIDIESNTIILPDFQQVLVGLQEGTYAGSPALWKDKEREIYLYYSKPYLRNILVLVGRKGADVSATNLSELKNVSLAVVDTYSYGELRQQLTEASLVYGENDGENLEKLITGEVDYILVEELLIEHLLNLYGIDPHRFLEMGRHPMVTRNLHLGLSKDLPEAESILSLFNNEILKMRKDGTYTKIVSTTILDTD